MPGYKSIDRIRTVTASTFDRLVLKGEGPIVVEFMSYGCAHCGVIEPDLQQVAEIVESTEKIFRVNIALDHLRNLPKIRLDHTAMCASVRHELNYDGSFTFQYQSVKCAGGDGSNPVDRFVSWHEVLIVWICGHG